MKAVIYGSILVMLIGCQSAPKDMYSDLYLRSEFTWWEAKPEFKFANIKDSTDKFVSAKVQADGNPYHIKIADRQWSENKNCGYKNLKSKVAQLDVWLELVCSYNYEQLNSTPIQNPIDFKPMETATYTFTLKMTLQGPSHLKITKN